MIRTCKCGNVMNDSTIPNKLIYWTYFLDEWPTYIYRILGERVYPVVRTVWHCEKCHRLLNWEPKDNKLYKYYLLNEINDSTDCSCKHELNIGTLLKAYSFNDYESFEIEKQIKNGEEPIFPREVDFCPKCKRVYVKRDGNLKIFCVEEVIDLVKN